MIAERVRRLRTLVTRTSPVPLLVRVGVFGAALAALLIAFPSAMLASRTVAVLALLSVLPAARPKGAMPTLVALATVVGWVLATSGYGERIALWRVLALASLLYAGHTLAALAACLPHDAQIRAEVVTGWVARALWVLLGSAVVLVAALAATGTAAIGGYTAFAIGGLVAALTAAGLLARIAKKTP